MIKSAIEQFVSLVEKGSRDEIAQFISQENNKSIDFNQCDTWRQLSALHILVNRPESADTRASLTLFAQHPKTALNTVDRDGNTPLHNAVYGQKKEFCRILLEAGADKNIKNYYLGGSKTPEALAREKGRPDIADFIRDFQKKDPSSQKPEEEKLEKSGEKSDSKKRPRGPKEPPAEFLDPITFEIMENPVITPSGITYDRKSIKKCLKSKQVDPQAGTPLTKAQLIPNLALKALIERRRKKHETGEKPGTSTTTTTTTRTSTGEPPAKRARFG